jgi:hypothetical protein
MRCRLRIVGRRSALRASDAFPATGRIAFWSSTVHDPRPMSDIRANAFVLTSARMAAGMTSRARRPEPFHPAG